MANISYRVVPEDEQELIRLVNEHIKEQVSRFIGHNVSDMRDGRRYDMLLGTTTDTAY
jgi:hypothetical protein